MAPAGPWSAEIPLAPLLDRNRSLVALRLGGACPLWRIGVGFDAAFRERFILMSCGERVTARRFAEGERLRHGIVLEPEPGSRYRLRFKMRVPRPAERSVLRLEPLDGTPGDAVQLGMKDLLERMIAAGSIHRVLGRELGFFYLTDIDPESARPAASRTLLVVEQRGSRSIAWPLPEASLPIDQPVRAKLGEDMLVLVRTAAGTLRIYPPESVSSSSDAAASR